ncbi:hypothetical protein [Methanobacterium alcaliphilum]|uniref:hypothetical protein n=1 Tax=Methanobacterium alcaliphilum TaxID=392018 RepID=UPI00200A1862|nr:hypothetical protein [Methanobacterium alcaliphilum]MCK9151540.1 hypothetical protein [Methanobacterium alcaliphilum]
MIDCVVYKALDILTDKLARGSNYVILSNNEDVERSKDILKKLSDDGQNIDPELIYGIVIRNPRWKDKEARKLKGFAQKIFEGVNPRIKEHNKYPADFISKLHEECENS